MGNMTLCAKYVDEHMAEEFAKVCEEYGIDCKIPACDTVVCETVNEAWEYWFVRLFAMARVNAATAKSRDGAVAAEVIGAVTKVMDPTRFIVTSPVRKLPMRYAVGELLWYLSGSNKLKDISVFTPNWERMSDDGETVNSCYGHKIHYFFGFDQWQDVKERLIEDPSSRQAIIHIKDPRPVSMPTNDTPCTLTLQFLQREGKLHLIVNMRSNDLWFGMPYDMFSFCSLQVKMAMELGLEVGTYTHVAGSLHVYERDLCKAHKHGKT